MRLRPTLLHCTLYGTIDVRRAITIVVVTITVNRAMPVRVRNATACAWPAETGVHAVLYVAHACVCLPYKLYIHKHSKNAYAVYLCKCTCANS